MPYEIKNYDGTILVELEDGVVDSGSSSLNLIGRNYSNFGTNGVEPPYVKCPACNIQFDCSNYPYDMSDKNGNVCTTCYEKTFLDNNNMPVYSRANGKPRVCRKLN